MSAVSFSAGGGGAGGDLYASVMEILRSDAAGQALQDHLNLSPIPAGAVTAWAGDTVKGYPGGWIPCDGRALGRDQYPALFRAIGVSYGAGNGVSSFNVPDLRGRVPLGAGTGVSGGGPLTPRLVGQTTGEESHQMTAAEMPSHAHTISDPGHKHAVHGNFNSGALASLTYAGSTFNAADTAYMESATTGITVLTNGGNGYHNNMQPSLVLSYLIKI